VPDIQQLEFSSRVAANYGVLVGNHAKGVVLIR